VVLFDEFDALGKERDRGQEHESVLGEKLFRRTGRNLVLTYAGQQALSYAEEILSLGQGLVNAMKQRPTSRPLRVNLGVADALPKLITYHLIEPSVKATHIEKAGVKLLYFPRVIRWLRYVAATPYGFRDPNEASPGACSSFKPKSEETTSNPSHPVQMGQVMKLSRLPRPLNPVVATVALEMGTTGKSGNAAMARRLAPRTVRTGSFDGSSHRKAYRRSSSASQRIVGLGSR
jgi:hypothetical protein